MNVCVCVSLRKENYGVDVVVEVFLYSLWSKRDEQLRREGGKTDKKVWRGGGLRKEGKG